MRSLQVTTVTYCNCFKVQNRKANQRPADDECLTVTGIRFLTGFDVSINPQNVITGLNTGLITDCVS